MFGGILGSTIVTQHPRDLKTSFLRFSRDFQHRFEISTLRFFSTFSVFEILGLLGHFFGRYLSPGAGMSRVSPDSWFSDRVDIFLRKNHQKILSFRKVTDLQRHRFFVCKKNGSERSRSLKLQYIRETGSGKKLFSRQGSPSSDGVGS